MRVRGFTLLELLVAMAIVAILVALALAGLKVAREKADDAQCMSNLRQLAQANLAYAAEHEGTFVPAQEPRNLTRWHGVRNGVGEPFNPTAGPLAPYLGTEGKVKLCPSFRDVLTGSKSFEEGTGGYGYNAVYIGGTPANAFAAERIANIPRPQATIMFSDAAFARQNGVQEYAYCEPWNSVGPTGKLRSRLIPSMHFRHQGRANVAWCDGHVTSERPTQLGSENSTYQADSSKHQIGWFGRSEFNGFWNPNADVLWK